MKLMIISTTDMIPIEGSSFIEIIKMDDLIELHENRLSCVKNII